MRIVVSLLRWWRRAPRWRHDARAVGHEEYLGQMTRRWQERRRRDLAVECVQHGTGGGFDTGPLEASTVFRHAHHVVTGGYDPCVTLLGHFASHAGPSAIGNGEGDAIFEATRPFLLQAYERRRQRLNAHVADHRLGRSECATCDEDRGYRQNHRGKSSDHFALSICKRARSPARCRYSSVPVRDYCCTCQPRRPAG